MIHKNIYGKIRKNLGKCIDLYGKIRIIGNINGNIRINLGREGTNEGMLEIMRDTQFNEFLELIAKLIEAKARTPEEAAQIVREAKTK